MIKVHHSQVHELIQSAQTGFAEFQKADGSLRKMVFRPLHPGDIKGTGPKILQNDRTNVFDLDAEGIRAITHNRVKSLEVDGVKYEVTNG